MKNYRPISNLPFLGKVIERCAMKQFVEYLNASNLFASTQSAYRQGHSIETALTRVYNDILINLDEKGGETILILLDLTAAFDTIDHELFIKRLQSRYGVGGTAMPSTSSRLISTTGVKVFLLKMCCLSLSKLSMVCLRGQCVVPSVLFFTLPRLRI